jgi:hypothetical protein
MMSPVLPCAGWNWLRVVPGSDGASPYREPGITRCFFYDVARPAMCRLELATRRTRLGRSLALPEALPYLSGQSARTD